MVFREIKARKTIEEKKLLKLQNSTNSVKKIENFKTPPSYAKQKEKDIEIKKLKKKKLTNNREKQVYRNKRKNIF